MKQLLIQAFITTVMLGNPDLPDAVFELRDAGKSDDEFLEKLFREVKTREFAGLDLPMETLNQLLQMQYKTQEAGFASQFPYALHRIVVVDGNRAGRIVTDTRDRIVSLVDIALLERYRGRGIGAKLLQQVCANAALEQHSVRLTVRFDNPALRLYQRAGFVQTGGDGLHHAMEWSRLPSQQEKAPVVHDQAETNSDDPLGARYFSAFIGRTLPARSMCGICVDLVLESVEPLRAAGRPANVHVPAGDSFALVFSGPTQQVLPSATTQVSMDSDTSVDIFLSAFGLMDGRLHYEAIFNRMGG